MSEQLKPCPFCGGNAEQNEWSRRGGGTGYGVFCYNLCVRLENERSLSDGYDTEEEAINAWNTRAGEKP